VVVSTVTVAGQLVTGGQALPVRLHLTRGMHAPMVLACAANDAMSSPAITLGSVIYVPLDTSAAVLVFGADGISLSPVPLAPMGLFTHTLAAAFVETTGTLLLANYSGASSKLVAVDVASRAARWSAALGGGVVGIAALPAQGVVVVSNLSDDMLHVHRLADGARVASATSAFSTYVAGDPATVTVYVSTGAVPSFLVSAFRWDGVALVADGVVEAAGTADFYRPLAVMPPTPGRHISYLVVGTRGTPTLLVLSLPDRRLVHSHTLEGIKVTGLAADPSGTAIAVCDAASKAIHVLP
jgi:hypothetical protein